PQEEPDMRSSERAKPDQQLWKAGFRLFQACCFFFVLLIVGMLWSTWAEATEPAQRAVAQQAAVEQSSVEQTTNKLAERVRLGDAQSGELMFKTGVSGEYTPALLLNTDVAIQATGLIATVTVTQEFKNEGRAWA